MTEKELNFPEWQEPLGEAILERAPRQLAEKTQKIETWERLRQSRTDGAARHAGRSVEEQALLGALDVMC
jgi:hypothetical protein